MRNDTSFPGNNLPGVLQLPFILSGRYGLIQVAGRESADLLNRLSTNNLIDRSSGDVVETILTTEKGRIIDVLLVLFRKDDILLVTTTDMTAKVLEWLERYTIMEDVSYTDISEQFSFWNIIGPTQFDNMPNSQWNWTGNTFGISDAIAASHKSVRGEGTLAIIPEHMKAEFTKLVEEKHIVTMATDPEYLLWRIENKKPDVGHELTDLVNPLESGAAAAVDFEKGCYIGQEVIARLDSYDKVQRQLASVEFDAREPIHAEPGTMVTAEGKNAGFITTTAFNPAKGVTVGLACIRHAFSKSGMVLSIQVDDISRTLHVV